MQFSSVQSLSQVRLFAIPWTAACQASLSITNTQSPPKPMPIESVMPSNYHILCHPLLPSIFPNIRVFFSNKSALRISAVQFSHSVVSESSQSHEPQHARPPCPLPTPGVHPNPCPLSQWRHPTISSSVAPFSSSPQSFPASGSFQMSQLFASRGQSIWVSATTSVLPMHIQDWSPLGWTGWTSLQSKGLSRVFSNTTVQTHQFFGT